MLDLKHTFNFSQAIQIKPIHCKMSRNLLESAVISKSNYIPQIPGFNQILSYLANIIPHENNINIKNGWKSATILLIFFSYSTSILLIFFSIRYFNVVKFF